MRVWIALFVAAVWLALIAAVLYAPAPGGRMLEYREPLAVAIRLSQALELLWLIERQARAPLPDPAAATGSPDEILERFREVRDEVARRVEALLASL